MASYKKLDSFDSFFFGGGFDFFVFGRQRGVRHFVYTQSTSYPNLVPRAFPFSWGGAPHEKWFRIAQKLPKKVLVFRKVARSCFLTEKLLKFLKVAKRLPSRIWKGLIITHLLHNASKNAPIPPSNCRKPNSTC